MFRSFFLSRKWWFPAWLGLFLIVGITGLNIYLVRWNTELQFQLGNLFQLGAKAENDWSSSMHDLSIVLGGFAITDAALSYTIRNYQLFWREALTKYYASAYIAKGEPVKDAPQKITDCVKEFTETTVEYFRQTIRSVFSLCIFVPVLWKLSGRFEISFLRDVPGALVWITLAVSGVSIFLSWLTTVKLRRLNDDNQHNEAVLRDEGFGWIQKNPGMPNAENVIWEMFRVLRKGYLWTFANLMVNDFWTGSYRQVWTYIPTAFFGRFVTNIATKVQYGLMAQAIGVITEVHGSLVFPAYILPGIQRYLSVKDRLTRLEDKLFTKPPKWHAHWPHYTKSAH